MLHRKLNKYEKNNIIDFDFTTDTPSLLFSQGDIFIQYDSTIFGTNLVNNGKITASKGQSIDSAYYNLSVTDSTSTMLKIAIAHVANATSLSNLDSLNQQLCHLKIDLSGFNLTTVAAAFDTIAMAGHSEYKRSVSGLDFPYSIVKVSGLVGAPSSYDITYRIVADSISYSSHPETLVFEVQAQTYANLDSAYVVITYDSIPFGSNVYANYTLNCYEGSEVLAGDDGNGDPIYDFSFGDVDASTFYISIAGDPSYYNVGNQDQTTPSFDSYQTLATCVLTITTCADTPSLALSTLSTGVEAVDDGNGGQYTYALNVNLGPEFNNNDSVMCPPFLMPSVSSWSPTCATGGTFDVLHIYGNNFGANKGFVWFTNASSPSKMARTTLSDVQSWTDNEIDLFIPSAGSKDSTRGTAGSGKFFVQTALGYTNSAENDTISIGYSLLNIRAAPDSLASLLYLIDTPVVFQLDSFLFYTTGALAAAQFVANDINQVAGVNFQIATTPSLIHTVNNSDHINLISVQPNNANVFGGNNTLLALTTEGNSTHSCITGLPQYNNNAYYVTDIDISFVTTPPSSYLGASTWNWDFGNYNLTQTQYDFTTVLAHEMGHAAGLMHVLPQRPSFNVMYPFPPRQNILRGFDADSNDILGMRRMLSLGQIMAQAGCHAADTPVYPPGYPRIFPAGCIAYLNGIDEVTNEGNGFNVSLFPNPYQESTIVQVDVWKYANFSITIYDMIGQVIQNWNISTDRSFDVPLSGHSYSAGMYLIEVSDSHTKKILKLIKF